jgi:hyperosmotically inducible periplasmic protein
MKKLTRVLVFSSLIALPLGWSVCSTGCASTTTRESTGEYIDDSVITAKVKAALFADKSVSGFAVKVTTFKGVVQLSGFVDSTAQKQQAETDARLVKGVNSVENNITVKDR